MARIREIVVDCDKPAVLARFWAEALDGYHLRPYDEAEVRRLAALGLTPETDPTVMVDGPGPLLCFQHVPGRTHGRGRWHIDIVGRARGQEVARLSRLGATVRDEHDGYTVMLDPEGNPFCVQDPTDKENP
jgi:hypothetical protein